MANANAHRRRRAQEFTPRTLQTRRPSAYRSGTSPTIARSALTSLLVVGVECQLTFHESQPHLRSGAAIGSALLYVRAGDERGEDDSTSVLARELRGLSRRSDERDCKREFLERKFCRGLGDGFSGRYQMSMLQDR